MHILSTVAKITLMRSKETELAADEQSIKRHKFSSAEQLKSRNITTRKKE